MLVDSHCHLDFDSFDDDREAVIERALAAGVGAMVTICTRLTGFAGVHAIAARHPAVYCSVGVHPHHANEEGVASPDRLIELAASPRVVGIGETGLDYHYRRSSPDAQRRSFRNHIDAARRTGLPLIVHARDADEEIACILGEEMQSGSFAGVMHCFSAGPELATAALEMGLYLSFSGIVTFKKADRLRDIARAAPLDRLLVETDSPYLAPVPERGKRNEPARVVHTAAALAAFRQLDPPALAEATTRNFFRLFARAAPAAADA